MTSSSQTAWAPGKRVRVLADSVNPVGKRITTVLVRIPRIVLAEINTHRALSRNTASNRAINAKAVIERVRDDPFVPEEFYKNGRGMQAREAMSADDQEKSMWMWKAMSWVAADHAAEFEALGLHKQYVNRLTEPFQWVEQAITATEWDNFIALRTALDGDGTPFAQQELFRVVRDIQVLRATSVPEVLDWGSWHVPFFEHMDHRNIPEDQQRMIAVGRLNRLSYMNHDGEYDIRDDIRVAERGIENQHLSPFEHVAQAVWGVPQCGNLRGNWHQLRCDVDRSMMGRHVPTEDKLVPHCLWCGIRIPVEDEQFIYVEDVDPVTGERRAFCGTRCAFKYADR